MDKFKIRIFEKEHPLKKFPNFRSIQAEEQKKIFDKISEKLGLGLQSDPIMIAKMIMQKGIPIERFNAEEENFTLQLLLSNLNIKPRRHVFLNWWYSLKDMDEFAFSDLNKFFNYIWFPGPDDIDIFDLSFNWIIHIHHDGFISFIKFKK